MAPSRHTIILSVSSDIGSAIAHHRACSGSIVSGTFRTNSLSLNSLRDKGVRLIYADFADSDSIDQACSKLVKEHSCWDELIVAPGTLEPIGLFAEISFDDWANSFQINFVNQLRAVHKLLPHRNLNASVLFFAGGGTNGSTDHFTAYTSSKIALIKMTELLDSEIMDAKFTILGPGWIQTKIHAQTLNAKDSAGSSFSETLRRIKNEEFYPMSGLLDCIDWISSQPKQVTGGKNISLQHDKWGTKAFADHLSDNPNLAKLRRYGNDSLGNSS